jgi:hypothetical protein
MSGMSEPGEPTDGNAAAQAEPAGARRIGHIVGAVLVVAVFPALLMWALVGEFGATAMFTGLLLGAVGSKLGGTRRMAYLAPGMGLAAGLGAYTAYDWWWAALLAAAGVITGAGIRFGWFGPLLMIPYAATFVVPEASGRNATITASSSTSRRAAARRGVWSRSRERSSVRFRIDPAE